LIDGTAVHNVTTKISEFHAVLALDEMIVPPPKILEERGRGTEIHSIADQAKLLQYWAWSQQEIEVGVMVPETKHVLEYWMFLKLQPLPGDEEPYTYHHELHRLWLEKLRQTSPTVAQHLETLGNDLGMRMRYFYNSLRVWFAPNASIDAGINRSLAEDPVSKDKWISHDMIVFSHPTLRDDQVKETPTALFGPGSYLQERYDDPEVQGGKLALIATKQHLAQKPPNFLDRMQSTFLKQLAYNQRVLNAEKEVAGINCDIAEFLSEISIDSSDQLIICVNGSEEMKRNESSIGGQLWIQGERQMTAANLVLEGMANTKEGAVLTAAVEAVTWKHTLEPDDGPRKGQRVVIYPKEMTQLEAVLSTGDPSIDSVDGRPIAYTPVFLKEDSPQVTTSENADKVPVWMNIAAQVAIGNRRMVLEDGPDVMNSDDDDAIEDVKPDEEKGMYTAEMDPEKGPVKLSQAQVATEKAAAHAMKPLRAPPRSQSPIGWSSDEDEPTGSEWVWSQTKGCMRKNIFQRKRIIQHHQRDPDPQNTKLGHPTLLDTGDSQCTPRSPVPEEACTEEGSRKEGGYQACRSRGYPTNGYPSIRSEQSWKLATGRGRLRGNGYACGQ
jgi:hypothetical protein